MVFSSMDRLPRSVSDLCPIVAELINDGVAVELIGEKAPSCAGTTDPFAEFRLNIMASFAQLKRSISQEWQAEGIRAAKARGVYQGTTRKMTSSQFANVREPIESGLPKARVARQFGVKRSTLYRRLSRNADKTTGKTLENWTLFCG